MGQNQPGFAEVPVACFGYSKNKTKTHTALHIRHYHINCNYNANHSVFFIKRINADKTYVTYDVTI